MLDQELLARAEAGDISAMMEIGNAYYLGKGVEQDVKTAMFWWRRAEALREAAASEPPQHREINRAGGRKNGKRAAVCAAILVCAGAAALACGVLRNYGKQTIKQEQPAFPAQQETQTVSAAPEQPEPDLPAEPAVTEPEEPAQPEPVSQEPEPVAETPEEPAEYILPQSADRLLTEADIQGLTARELNYARNEIYARHGRMFLSAELTAYFEGRSWYTGTVAPDAFPESTLSDMEAQNAVFLREAELERMPGGYVLDYGVDRGCTSVLLEDTLRQFGAYLSGNDNYGFLLSYYEDPRDVNLDALFYQGAGLENRSGAPGAAEAAEALFGNVPGDVIALSRDDLDGFLREKTGFGLSDMGGSLSWTYDSHTDLYYQIVSDTNYTPVECTGGRMDEKGNYILDCTLPYWGGRETQLTLRPTKDGFRFVRNQELLVTEADALQIAYRYWNVDASDPYYFIMYQGTVTGSTGTPYYYYILKVPVDDHWTAVDYLYIHSVTGETFSQRP